jgi:hypothetical protein
VVRGGAFNNNDRNVRCAYRNNNDPNNRNDNNGFRVVGVAAHVFRSGIFAAPEMPGGGDIARYPALFRAEALKNGAAWSRPMLMGGRGLWPFMASGIYGLDSACV